MSITAGTDQQNAIQDIAEYIEVFYSPSAEGLDGLGFLSPVVYEQRFYARLPAA